MNRRGIFISFMAFLLIASVLLLHDSSKKAESLQERKNIEEAAFNNINNAFNNVFEEGVSLNKVGYARVVQYRQMPFEYDLNKNYFILRQRVPVRTSLISTFIDALNIYSVFANSETTTDLNIFTETVKNKKWGGTQDYPDLNFVILPQCLLYDVNNCCFDVNLMILKELQDGEKGCVGGFDYADLNTVYIDVRIYSDEYVSHVPPLAGTFANKTDPFDPASELPYAKITITESNPECPGTGCLVTANGEEVRSGHFDPLTWAAPEALDTLIIHCNAQDKVKIKLGKESANDPYPFVLSNTLSTAPVYFDLNMSFDQKVELFFFTEFSISVGKKNFSIRRTT